MGVEWEFYALFFQHKVFSNTFIVVCTATFMDVSSYEGEDTFKNQKKLTMESGTGKNN